jgi:capsule polysaccharide modification protein KpsS
MDAEEGLSGEETTLVARLLVDEERNKAEVFRKALEARPKSTKKAFDKKQVEFIDWATRKGYPSPEMVTEEKVALFLEEQVLYRKNRNCKDGSKTVGKSTVNQYIAALTALWKYQVLYNTNTNRTPRGVLVRAFNVA